MTAINNDFTAQAAQVLREWRRYEPRQVEAWVAWARQGAAQDGREKVSASDLRAAFVRDGGRLVAYGERG